MTNTTKTKTNEAKSARSISAKSAAKKDKAVSKATSQPAKALVRGKGDLARLIADKLDTTQTQAEAFLNSYIEAVTETLAQGKTVALMGFGTFEVRQRAARTGRNPQSGETITIAATQAVGFKTGSQLKKAVAGGKQ